MMLYWFCISGFREEVLFWAISGMPVIIVNTEREVLTQTFASDDGNEGVTAYLEKRTAKFTGH